MTLEEMQCACNYKGVEPYDHGRETYSGRGMFGNCTYAVVVEGRDTAEQIAAAGNHRLDNLGMDYIVY